MLNKFDDPILGHFYPMHGSSQSLVFREDFRQINCSQSVKMKIWCCKKICQIYATRDICWYRFGYLGRPTVWKTNFFEFSFLKIQSLLNSRWNNFISEPFHLQTQEKIKFTIQTNARGILERIVDGTFGRTWLARFRHVQSKTHGVAISEHFQIRSFVMIL